MTLQERYARNNTDDQLHFGALCDAALNGEFGLFVKAVINGLQAEWLAASGSDMRIPADRVLGRFEGLNALLDRLEYCIEARRRLLAEQQAAAKVQGPDGEPPPPPQGVQ